MGARFLLIDGYNLLHAARMARSHYAPGELQRCRLKLLRFLAARLSRAESARATIVFDARDPLVDRPHEQRFAGLKVLFARPEGDADLVIARCLDRHSAPNRVTLVSSDRELQRAARSCGARWVGSDEFLEQLERRRAIDNEGGDESRDARLTEGLSPAEAAAWMNYFGNLDAAVWEPAEPELPPVVESSNPASQASPPAGPPAGDSNRSNAGNVERARGRKRRKTQLPPTVSEKPGTRTDAQYWAEQFGVVSEAGEAQPFRQITQKDLEKWLREFEEEDQR